MRKFLATLLLPFILPKVATFQFTKNQLGILQGAPEFPVSIHALVSMTHVVEINEAIGQATFFFYVEIRRFEPRLLSILPQNANGSTQCFLLGKGKMPANFDFMFTWNAIEHKCYPGISSDTFLCSNGQIVTGRKCKVTVTADFSGVRDFPFDSHRLPLYFAHPVAGEQFFNVTYATIGDLKAAGLFHLDSQDWVVEGYNCSKEVHLHPGNPLYERYPVVKCYVQIRRKSWSYIFGFCLPSSLITILGLAGIKWSFMGKGPGKGPGFQIALMTLMSVCVLLVSLSNKMPRSDEVSHMQIFCSVQIGLVMSSIAFNFALRSLPAKCKQSKVKPRANGDDVQESGKKKQILKWMGRVDTAVNCLFFMTVLIQFIRMCALA